MIKKVGNMSDYTVGQSVCINGARTIVFWVAEINDDSIIVSGRENLAGLRVTCLPRDLDSLEITNKTTTVDEELSSTDSTYCRPDCNPPNCASDCNCTKCWIIKYLLSKGKTQSKIAMEFNEALVTSLVGRTIINAEWLDRNPNESWTEHEYALLYLDDERVIQFGAWGYDNWGATVDDVTEEEE